MILKLHETAAKKFDKSENVSYYIIKENIFCPLPTVAAAASSAHPPFCNRRNILQKGMHDHIVRQKAVSSCLINMKKPHIAQRILLQFASFLVCTMLITTIFFSAALYDLAIATSSGTIEAIINQALTNPEMFMPPLASATGRGHAALALDEEKDIMHDIDYSNTDVLAAQIYDMLYEYFGDEVPLTVEQIDTLIEESTVTDFISTKVAEFAKDALTGENTAEITVDEVMKLLDENAPLIEHELGIAITDEMRQAVSDIATEYIVEYDINEVIHTKIEEITNSTVSSATGLTLRDVLDVINSLTSPLVIIATVVIILFLIAVLMLSNFYKPACGLTWASAAFIFEGIILSLCIPAVKFIATQYASIGDYMNILDVFLSQIAPIHYGALILGVLMLAGSVTWRILAKSHKHTTTPVMG